jgi:hypothetical protein
VLIEERKATYKQLKFHTLGKAKDLACTRIWGGHLSQGCPGHKNIKITPKQNQINQMSYYFYKYTTYTHKC